MDCRYFRDRRPDNDREGIDSLPVGTGPGVPESGQGEGVVIGAVKVGESIRRDRKGRNY